MRFHRTVSACLVRGLTLSLVLLAACAPAAQPSPTAAPAAKPAAQKPADSAAAQPAAKPAQTTAPAAPPKPTGELTAVIADLRLESWDPTNTTPMFTSTGIGGPIYESLYLHMPPDAAPKPWLLESGTMAPDAMSWTFKLRDGIRWSTGDPMTAEDVKFSFDRYMSPQSVSAASNLFRSSIASVEVVDRLTTRVVMKQPLITLPYYLAGRMGNEGLMLPKKYVEQVGWDTFNLKPIGSGPYKLAQHKPGESATYTAVENHWRTTAMYSKINLLMVAEERARIAMLQGGKADLVQISPDNIKETEGAGFKTIVIPYTTMWRVHFYGAYGDYPDNPLKKLEVRKALSLAVNKKEILDGLYGGAGEVAAYPHSAPGASFGAPKLPLTPYDVAQAKQLLAQAGYPNGLDIILSAPNIGCSAEQAAKFAQAIGGFWEQIGVRAQIRPIDYAVFRPKVRGADGKVSPEYVGTAATFCTSGSPLAQRDLNLVWYSKGEHRITNAADEEIAKVLAATSNEELEQWSEAAYKKVYDAWAAVGVFHGGQTYSATKKFADSYTITPGLDSLLIWLRADHP